MYLLQKDVGAQDFASTLDLLVKMICFSGSFLFLRISPMKNLLEAPGNA